MHKVYFLEKYSSLTNAYKTSREETWSWKTDKTFDNESDASEYMREKNRYTPEFVLVAEGINGVKREELLTRFCFDDKYLLKKRYFVEPLPNDKLKEEIKNNYILGTI